MSRAMFDTLVYRDNTLKIAPQLATSWQTIDDLTWEFKLRTDVKFHNGEPLDATAVKFSIDRFIDPQQKAGSASRLSEVDRTDIVDSSTVHIHTRTPFPTLLLGLNWAFILPPKYTQENPDRLGQQPVGTGPFKFVDWAQGDHVTMAANESYFGGRPSLDKFTYRIIPDDSARFAALKAGEIDIMQNVPLDSLDEVSKDPSLTVAQSYTEAGLIFEFDTLHGGPTANEKVRQALNYAVDKQTIITSILHGKVKPLEGQILTDGILGFNPDVKAFPYDVAKAKQLLAEAGYPNGFEIDMNGPRGRYAGDRDVLTAVADQLQKVAVKANLNAMEPTVWNTKLGQGQVGPMFMIAWFSNGDPALALSWFTTKSSLGVYYNDPTFEKLMSDGNGTIDTDKRKQIYLQAMQYMNDHAMALFMYQPSTFYAIKKKVQGFVARPDDIPTLYPVSVQG